MDLGSPFYSEDGSLTNDTAVYGWMTDLLNASRKFERHPCPGMELAGYLQDAGFQNIRTRKFRMPDGSWPKDRFLKEIGRWNLLQIAEGLEAFTMRLYTQILERNPKEVQGLLDLAPSV
ncbi:hypothetical protein MMC31_004410 [Peltigera leucophlebia]|nr:hypothetical protein [Peltigera leucophlebia]